MNKKSVLFDFLFVFFLTILILLTSFSTSYILSDNTAKNNLSTYANNVSLALTTDDNLDSIKEDYRNIIDLRVTIFNEDADVLLEINNEDQEPAIEDRLEELKNNTNSFYYKNSLTLGYEVLYYVVKNGSNYIRVGLPRSIIERTSFNILIYGSIAVVIIDVAYGFIKYKLYKKSLNKLKENVLELEKIAGLNYDLSNDDGNQIISETLSQTSKVIKDQVEILRNEKEKTYYILDSIEEGFIVIDGDNNCILINRFALEKLELKKENVLKKTFHNLALGNDLNNGLLQAFRYNTSSFDKEINGQIYKFLLTKLKLNVFQNSNKSGVGIIFFNVTQERLNEKIRREFFQNASHELKTPLTTIIGYEEMIDSGIIDNPKEIEKAREAVIKESKRMQSVIEDMLALSSLEYNMSNEKKVDIDVKSVIKDVISSFEYLINERNIDCHVRLKDVTLKMVPKDLERLVRNLVSNAIKYNKENGKIIVTLSDKYLSVKDNGIGIDKKDLMRIFERFYRVDKGRSREQGGTGLGLAIVKHICLNYGFKIEVDSKVMQGSEFKIYFNN